ncbi:unnamed protein product [Adineta ricciae]|uniref:Condensin complex subunit 2 n=1 Tax=Adineta ricciae TaxID=249248 RepID=A0A815KHZ8_ADIRI|nr:unnamed protein product [Adineta ricciae]CAF1523719.1 unnamed protein product [Adineta ricciae]
MIDNDETCLPIARRSLNDRYSLATNHFSSDNELSPCDRRQSRLSFNTSISIDSGIDEQLTTPKQLLALYEKTVELATKNKINIRNAFQIPLVERLPEVLELVAFDDKVSRHEPNFVKVGSIIDTSAKIYSLRVDALHNETQKLSGSIQPMDDEDTDESIQNDPERLKNLKKPVQQCKTKANSYLASDLSSISLPFEFDFHPLQSSNMCRWPGGVGSDSIYADMVSYTMYSSSDFPLIKGFVDLNSRMNMAYVDHERLLDETVRFTCDLIPLREAIKDDERENHIIGSQTLREFTFNEEPTVSYIETIDECSIVDSLNIEDDHNLVSDLRDEPTSFYCQELQSTYTCPMTMPSMDVTLVPNKMSFVDHVPHLLRENTELSDYTYFDATKLKLFAGPYVWRYVNLLPNIIKPSLATCENTSIIQNRLANSQPSSSCKLIRTFRLNFSTGEDKRSVTDIMNLNPLSKAIIRKRKQNTMHLSIPKHTHQLRLTRRACPLTDLMHSNNFSEFIFDNNLQRSYDNFDDDPFYGGDEHDPPNYDDHPPLEYDFVRPVHYDRIECDRNLTKIDTKKLQYQLADEYQTEYTKSSTIPITFSTLCVNLMEKTVLSIDKTELISAFYCMLNNCNRKNLFMKHNRQQDDLIIQQQPFRNEIPLSYSHKIF